MNKEEFIKWLEISWEREISDDDYYWRYMTDWNNCEYDYLEVEENKVIFKWERLDWGGRNYEEDTYTFEKFVELSEEFELKY